MPDRVDRFFKNRVSATGHCILETNEVLLPAILFFGCAGSLCLAYAVMFDPDAVNTASRLNLLSINPDKWT